MAGSVNKVILVGNLGKDPKVANLNSGDKVVSFTLATSETWKDKNTGERREKTEWHNIVVFNENIGRIVEQYCKKGTKVYLEGQLQSRKYTDQSGAERYTTEVVLQRFRGELTLLDSLAAGKGATKPAVRASAHMAIPTTARRPSVAARRPSAAPRWRPAAAPRIWTTTSRSDRERRGRRHSFRLPLFPAVAGKRGP